MSMGLYIIAFLVALLAAVVVHEGGHAVAARLFGREVELLIDWPRGVAVRHDGRYIAPWQEAVITAAGPAANLAAWLLLGGAVLFEWDPTSGSWDTIREVFGGVQFWMAALNLVPQPQSDGWRLAGKIARAAGVRRP